MLNSIHFHNIHPVNLSLHVCFYALEAYTKNKKWGALKQLPQYLSKPDGLYTLKIEEFYFTLTLNLVTYITFLKCSLNSLS